MSVGDSTITRRLSSLSAVESPTGFKVENPIAAPNIIVRPSRLKIEGHSIPRLSNAELVRFSESGNIVPLVEDAGAFPIRMIEAAGKTKVEKTDSGSIGVKNQLFTMYGIPNANRRIYPASEMKLQIEEGKKKCREGQFGGAVDHPWEMERMSRTCIRFDSMDSQDVDDKSGYGFADLEIISKHRFGGDLCCNIESGCSVGLSTYGWGMARRPTEAEQKLYSLSPDSDVVIISGYSMEACDAVYRPSVSVAVVPGM